MCALTSFILHVLEGNTPALNFSLDRSFSDRSIKEGGGIRPITVGQTLRRLAARYVSSCIAGPLGSFLALHQLGFGIALSCEAAAYAARRFLC